MRLTKALENLRIFNHEQGVSDIINELQNISDDKFIGNREKFMESLGTMLAGAEQRNTGLATALFNCIIALTAPEPQAPPVEKPVLPYFMTVQAYIGPCADEAKAPPAEPTISLRNF